LDHGAEVLLAGMKIPPNYGEHYARGFEQVYRGLAEEYDVTFMPFLLEDVAARRQYTQADGIHPVGAGYRVVARNVWDYLKPLIQKTPS
ncbi:MAG: arylesterase, partial [Nitrospinaceae bacterium]|nr:arylesterase [Nitrospinaceae bacterium]NIR54750.1 arylesterase [Nitrospinaceae bacterium]NIS85175.1 arylesterase [Nitrospinaceae bacterium]NIU44249.1 arylesterase [Nitrospinaceae bacterium]NIU96380.1 arylesterase [Nitrospinaceae bacterium]